MRLVALIAILGGVAAAVWVVRTLVFRAKPEVESLSDQWIADHQADQST